MSRLKQLSEDQELNASLYALGALGKYERADVERMMENDSAFADHVAALCDMMTDVAVADARPLLTPPADLKQRVLERIDTVPVEILRAFNLKSDEGFVMTNLDGRIEWVNSEFTNMCGYTLDELRGRKPGHMLQGPATDPSSVAQMRQAFRQRRPINVEMVNYHKDGDRYWVSISMSPILDEQRQPRCFVAIERELRSRETPVMLA